MTTAIVTLIAAVIAALTSIGSLLLNTRLAIRKEQRLLLWGKEFDRLIELEEMAGVALDATGHRDILETLAVFGER